MGYSFPNESRAYRAARERLLRSELALRKLTEDVAAQRRKLPLGGAVAEDYRFDDGSARGVTLSQLFGGKKTLVLYSYMFGPKMAKPCPLCTSFLDGLEGNAHHIAENVALAVTVKSPLARVKRVARERGWRRLRLLSDGKTSYHKDYGGEDDDGGQLPMMNVFVKRGKRVHHFWASEMLSAHGQNGFDARHIDAMWPLWNVLDLTPEGRGRTWYPKLSYKK